MSEKITELSSTELDAVGAGNGTNQSNSAWVYQTANGYGYGSNAVNVSSIQQSNNIGTWNSGNNWVSISVGVH